MTPDAPVWLTTLHEPAHRPATGGRTRCGLPCTTSATRTATGISTIAAFVTGLCPECWPDQTDDLPPNPSTKENDDR